MKKLLNTKKLFNTLATSVVAIALSAGVASATVILAFGPTATSTEGTGASGTATLSFADEGGNVRLSALIENTTGDVSFGLGATSSSLTAFGFDFVSGASYFGGFTAGTVFDNLIVNANAAPYGTLEIAGSSSGSFNGAGSGGTDGIPTTNPNSTDTFSFLLSYSGNASVLESAFRTAFTTSPVLTSVMRFREVDTATQTGLSDKLTNPDVAVVPLPAAGWMLLVGIGGLAAMRRRRKAAVA